MRTCYFAAMNLPLPLDHHAIRVLDREAAATRLTLMGYWIVADFDLVLEDGSTAKSYAMAHSLNPEIFVSSGPEGSKIHRWVEKHGGKGAVHHIAYAVDSVAETMAEWLNEGVVFDRKEPLVCPCETPLVQIFTEEDPATGMIYELIERNGHPGFCQANVARLMGGSS